MRHERVILQHIGDESLAESILTPLILILEVQIAVVSVMCQRRKGWSGALNWVQIRSISTIRKSSTSLQAERRMHVALAFRYLSCSIPYRTSIFSSP
jgi:hypothetical protein